ncbi:MAG: LUD domain-containing protein, partial [Chloroflexota bacterium]|nr:LUD domain-containing protein [Chloroflexota bacterium]
ARVARRALTPPDERARFKHHERQGDFPERTHTPEPFRARYRQALSNDRMRAGVLRFQQGWRNARDTAFADYAGGGEMGETYGQGPAPVGVDVNTGAGAQAAGAALARQGRSFEALRDELAAVKDRTIEDAERYLAEFTAVAERGGAVVYRSSSAEDAGRYIADLCERKGIRHVAKSKSMLSEEIGLNPILEGRGIRIAETDLGEWLVQLAEERPSHIIGPALHMDRRRTAELLSRATGEKLDPDDIAAQVRLARRTLRREFLAAGLGISGANALVCETGTMMLVTNEGNAELVTSLPDIHVVLVGIEKLLPTMADAMTQVRLLARSGTGQPITVYTTFISGPDRPGKELHYVFVDNGRSAMRSDPAFRPALRCIRCGACADVCPPYQVVGGHAFGYIYSGAIGLVNTPFHHGLANGAGPQSLCVSCNACATVCPVAIPLPRQILDVRREVIEEFGLPPYKRPVLELWSNPALFDRAARLAARLARPLVEPGSGGQFVRHLPGAGAYQRWRSLPVPAQEPARDRLFGDTDAGVAEAPVLAPPLIESGATGVRVAYFIQCLTDRLYPAMAEATVRVLQACGARVVVPVTQHCCGLPAFDSGDWNRARAMARATIETLEHTGAEWIVTAGASCAVAIAHDYAHLFAGEPEWRARAEALAARTLDLTSFLTRVARLPDGALHPQAGRGDGADAGPGRVTYHNFCQSHNVLGLKDEPRRLIRDVMGLELVELPEAAVCCGFGGSVSMDHPHLAEHILARKLRNLDQTGARTLVTDNPGCIMHLRGGIDASGRNVRVLHLVELLDDRLRAKFPAAFAPSPSALAAD